MKSAAPGVSNMPVLSRLLNQSQAWPIHIGSCGRSDICGLNGRLPPGNPGMLQTSGGHGSADAGALLAMTPRAAAAVPIRIPARISSGYARDALRGAR